MTATSLDSAAQRLIRRATERGCTVRQIVDELVAAGVQTSKSAVSRFLVASAAKPARPRRPRGAARADRSKSSTRPARKAVPQTAASGQEEDDDDLDVFGAVDGVADYLETRLAALMARANKLEGADQDGKTIEAQVKLLRAIADLGEKVRALRPPPPPDPEAAPDARAAVGELLREVERLVVAVEREGSRA